jgi:serine/threonine protein kinase
MTPARWRQIRDLLDSALQMDGAERAAYLDRQCANDPSLRQELDKLIAVEAELPDRFLGSLAVMEVASQIVSSGSAILAAGTRLGPYQVETLLGAGGMGEVYRARDPRLGRDIAIKVLNEKTSESTGGRARFEREARAAGALNHPNILAVYDFGLDNDRFYIAGELVQGESLRERILRGPVPVRELYRIAVQLADGMAAAHAAGIVHRDLKPANVMLTPEGRVKILDFGLARQTGLARASASALAENDSTLLQVDTHPGTVLGTVAYMSPEQVRGQEADHRSDQFSLGVILYEMATGARPFSAETSVETMSAILTIEPKPIDSKIPTPLRWTIARCLEKDAGARYESTRDLYHDLRGQQEHLSDVFTSTEAPPTSESAAAATHRSWWPKAAVAAIALALAAGAVWWASRHPHDISRYRFTPMEVSWENPLNPVWSPDGKAFAYDAEVAGVRQVFLRYLNSPTPVQFTQGSADSAAVGWSADGKRFISGGKNPQAKVPPDALFSTPVFGGEPELLLTADVGYAATSPDGKALAAIVEEDGKLVLKTSSPIGAPFEKYAPAPFETKESFQEPNLRFAPDGRQILLLFDQPQGRLSWKLPWPPGRETPRQAFLRLPTYGRTPFFTWLPDSRHIILSLQDRQDDRHQHLWIADVDSGARRPITSTASSEMEPALSPDGKKLLFEQFHQDCTFVSLSLENAAAERVISSELRADMPAWAMRRQQFAYVTTRNGPPEVWVRGEGRDQPLVTPASFPTGTTGYFITPALSPGADRLIYSRLESNGHIFNWISSVSGGPPVRLTNDSNNAREFGGSWSPDGKSFTYLRLLNGEDSVMIAKTTGEAKPVLVRANIGVAPPQWSPDGQWIKFLDHDGGKGWALISPDGKTERALGVSDTIEMTFSKDSSRLYGIRREQGRERLFLFYGIRQEQGPGRLFSLDLATMKVKNIGELARDFVPRSVLDPGMRLSLAPDGKSILYPVVRDSGSLWMLEGFE